MSLLDEAAAKAVGAPDVTTVRVTKVSNPPYEGRHYEVTNRHTGSIIYLDLSDLDTTETAPAEPDPVVTIDDTLDELTVAELKGVARRLGVTIGGAKAVLLSRIKASMADQDDL